MNLNQYASQSAQPGLAVGKLQALRIPVPPFEEQIKIASTLDKFDALTNSISEGLPREIELRQKQYEYYRDLLFQFPVYNAQCTVGGRGQFTGHSSQRTVGGRGQFTGHSSQRTVGEGGQFTGHSSQCTVGGRGQFTGHSSQRTVGEGGDE